MRVSGCGKSSVGTALSMICGIEFNDGDVLHPKCNVEKMASGDQLNDDNRAPWLAQLVQTLAEADGPIVVGCSALKRMYRDWVRKQVGEPVHFLHLDAQKDVLARRAAAQKGHLMPQSLPERQFATLERLGRSKLGKEINIAQSFDQVILQPEHYVGETMI